MDTSEVKFIVEDNLEQLKQLLNLMEWDIDIAYGDCDGDPAVNICDVDYKIIEIRFDPVYMKDKAGVIHALLHELIHAIVGVFSTYRQTVSCFLTEAEREAMDIIYRNADERLVCDLVRILEGVEGEKTM